MKNNNKQSQEVKREIFENLSKESRFVGISELVVDAIKRGQDPVVIESFTTSMRKAQPNDELWKDVFTSEESSLFAPLWCKDKAEVKAALISEAEVPYRESIVTIKLGKNQMQMTRTFTSDDNLMKRLMYFGNRDKNYFKIYFRQLGYHVSDGNVGERQGLLISLGD